MTTQPTLYLLHDSELDAVTGGKHKAASTGGTVVGIVEVSIGEIVATGHSSITLNIVGAGSTSGGSKHAKGSA